MNFNETHIDLYDRYLRGEMTAGELASFEQRLAADKDFAAEFEVHRILVEGIKDHSRKELKEFLSANAVVPATGKFRINRMYYAAAAAIVVFISIFVVSQFYTTSKTASEIALKNADQSRHDSVGGAAVDPGIAKSLEENKNLEAPVTRSERYKEIIAAAPGEAMADMPSVKDDMAMQETDSDPSALPVFEDVYIATEKKLSDTTVTVPVLLAMLDETETLFSIDKIEQKTSAVETTAANGIMRNRKIRKLPANIENNASRPNAQNAPAVRTDTVSYAYKTSKSKDQGKTNDQLVKAEDDKAGKKEAGPSFKIEYWQSPVNFRGYKYIGNTLQFYGLNRNNTRVFMLNGLLYLRTDGMVYKLTPCQDGCAYKSELDSKIVDYIIQQP